uniref:Uncharacterized protein n=1 Tax=Anguilla anguilla TaxID=7936 RepID=A0A0E9Q6Z4_ANGAN
MLTVTSLQLTVTRCETGSELPSALQDSLIR